MGHKRLFETTKPAVMKKSHLSRSRCTTGWSQRAKPEAYHAIISRRKKNSWVFERNSLLLLGLRLTTRYADGIVGWVMMASCSDFSCSVIAILLGLFHHISSDGRIISAGAASFGFRLAHFDRGKKVSQFVTKKTHPAVVELHVDNTEGQVRVVPRDRDVMAMPVELAIEACRAFNQQIRFKDQFDLLLDRIAVWLQPRESIISAAYVTTREAGLLFLVVLKGKRRDDDIEAALTELDLEVANDKDFDLINLNVHSIPCCPEETLRSFLSEKLEIRYVLDGDRNRPH